MSTLKIFGPPGTGKTTYLLNKLELELKTVQSRRIAFLTFTRAARTEALQRTKMSEKDLPFLRTIHAICYRQMSVSQTQMVKPKMLREFGKKIGTEITGYIANPLADEFSMSDGKPTKADMLLNLSHLGRHRKAALREMLATADVELDWEFSKWFTIAYKDWKEAESLLDFTDLLTVYLKFGQPLDIDVMFVDEAQDLSRLQWDVVRKLGSRAKRIYIAGDDDQAIFTWAGASATAFIDEPAQHQVILDQSRRCPRAVMRVAEQIIGNVMNRVEKHTKPRDAEGQFDTVSYIEQSLFDGDHDKFLLFRNHHRGLRLSGELEEMSIPYLGANSPFSEKHVLNALSAFHHQNLGIAANVYERTAVVELADVRYLKKDADILMKQPGMVIDLFKKPDYDLFAVLGRLPKKSYVQRCVELHGMAKVLAPTLTLQSIHQSKGQEAHTVILDTELAKKTYDGMMVNPDDEHRVWYVGVTRAREKLIALLPTNQLHYQI
jgi:DNA helicase-2/ATP-dependent DNA helicase PcrA